MYAATPRPWDKYPGARHVVKLFCTNPELANGLILTVEVARLTGQTVEEIYREMVKAAEETADEWGRSCTPRIVVLPQLRSPDFLRFISDRMKG